MKASAVIARASERKSKIQRDGEWVGGGPRRLNGKLHVVIACDGQRESR